MELAETLIGKGYEVTSTIRWSIPRAWSARIGGTGIPNCLIRALAPQEPVKRWKGADVAVVLGRRTRPCRAR